MNFTRARGRVAEVELLLEERQHTRDEVRLHPVDEAGRDEHEHDEEVEVLLAGLKTCGDVGGECSLRLQLRRYEIKLLQEAIAVAEGDRRVAAQRLGISLSSLYRKVGEAP